MMNYKEIRSMIEEMAKENHEDFVKALISFEKGVNDKEALGMLYERYMENDSMSLLNDEFDYMIDELRESGQIRDNVSFEKEDNDLVNIVGNVVGKMEVIERVSKTGEALRLSTFLLYPRMQKEINTIPIARLMETRRIFLKALSLEIL